ncbi:hypothetical protein CAOG_009529 [Capsaspora owczarzaki ATCC 30864]|uniref:ATPase AAA-type core domain-containing protein n=1 Tax=Capsaspora owczarzaki (strain ATCC 30864) TaxID=595528 RepID=A0A0D2U7S5_CAPO3|nr:hypothetical protein CAOG_009529 [Capsaspora owczarzaki ATCC 30864]
MAHSLLGAPDEVLRQCDNRCAHNVLLDQLWDLNLRVLLIIDELDEGYRHASDAPFRSTLAGLQALGNSTSGRVAVVLCGSSSSLPDLICGRRKDGFRDGWPNLNSTKFSLVRIPSPSPLDESLVASILSQTKLCPSTLVNQRHLLYLAGTNIRSLHVHLSDAKHPMPEVDLEQLEDGPHQYHKCARPLLTAILDKLIDKNKELLEELVDMKVLKAIPSQIQSVDWPSRFLPVDEIEIDALWKKLQDHLKVASDLQAPLPRTLRHLLDEGVLIEVEGDYFPYSLAGLLASML